MGRGGLYYRQSLNPGASVRPNLPSSTTIDEPLQSIDSGDVAQMIEGSSADLLNELNRIKRRISCLTLFGNIDLDLRQATLERDVVTVLAIGLFGAIDVYVPEGVEVDMHGLALGGHKRAQGNDPPPLPGTPLVRVTAISIFAGIDVWRVPLAWAQRAWREVIRGIRAGAHRELES